MSPPWSYKVVHEPDAATRALLKREMGSDLYMNGALKTSCAGGLRHTSVRAVVLRVTVPEELGMGRGAEVGKLAY